MDRDDEARQGDTGMIGRRTRLGSHAEGAGAIGFDVAAAEEGVTQETPPEDRPGYEPERPVGDVPAATAPVATTTPLADARDPDLAAEPVVDRESFGRDPATFADEPVVDQGSYDDVGRADSATFADEPPAAEGPASWFEDAGTPDRSAVADEARRRRPSDGR